MSAEALCRRMTTSRRDGRWPSLNCSSTRRASRSSFRSLWRIILADVPLCFCVSEHRPALRPRTEVTVHVVSAATGAVKVRRPDSDDSVRPQ